MPGRGDGELLLDLMGSQMAGALRAELGGEAEVDWRVARRSLLPRRCCSCGAWMAPWTRAHEVTVDGRVCWIHHARCGDRDPYPAPTPADRGVDWVERAFVWGGPALALVAVGWLFAALGYGG